MVTIQCNEFDIHKIAMSGQCFRMVERYEFGNFVEVNAMGKLVRVLQEDDRIHLSCSEEDYESTWRSYFDLNTNYAQIIQSAQQQYADDRFLMESIAHGRGIRILRQDFFETLISFIISQRKSIPDIKRCISTLNKRCEAQNRRIEARGFQNEYYFGTRFPNAAEILALGIDGLSSCHVGYRDKYIYDAAKWYLDFPGDWKSELTAMGYEEAMKALMRIRGVGPKVANCVCLFGLHQMNACPVDVWVKRIIDRHYDGNIPQWFHDPNAGLLQQFAFFCERETVPNLIEDHPEEGTHNPGENDFFLF